MVPEVYSYLFCFFIIVEVILTNRRGEDRVLSSRLFFLLGLVINRRVVCPPGEGFSSGGGSF